MVPLHGDKTVLLKLLVLDASMGFAFVWVHRELTHSPSVGIFLRVQHQCSSIFFVYQGRHSGAQGQPSARASGSTSRTAGHGQPR